MFTYSWIIRYFGIKNVMKNKEQKLAVLFYFHAMLHKIITK